jgi:hypothetical protein
MGQGYRSRDVGSIPTAPTRQEDTVLENINRHHQLEAKLYALRLLRDLGHPDFKEEEENNLLDEMEALWNRMGDEEREILERERKVRSSLRGSCPPAFPFLDVSIEKWRQGLPPRIPKPTGPDSDPTRQ